MRYGSLFSGFGGMDLGFDRAGWSCAWQVEINPYARRVLEKHWPGVRRHGDVRTFPGSGDWSVDAIIGGDPCQANTIATGPNSAGSESLGGEFLRVVGELRPRIVVRENPTRVRASAPWPWWRFRHGLESLGYAVLPFRLRACCFGTFHQRDRLFLLAERTDANRKRLEGWKAQTKGGHSGQPARRIHADDWIALHASRGFGSRAGLPEYVERVTGIGNSVTPMVAEWIARSILESDAA